MTKYTIKIGMDASFTRLLGTYTVSASSYTPKSSLPANTTLFWSIRINKKDVDNPWSATRSLTTAFPPSVPTLLKPANNALVTTYTPLLDWSDSKVSLLAPAFDHYRVQVADNADFSNPVLDHDVAGISNSFYTLITPLAPKTKYYWRVSAYDAKGEYSAWSAVRIFRTK